MNRYIKRSDAQEAILIKEEEEKERQREIQRDGLRRRLREGTRVIKRGHEIQGLSNGGTEIIVPLSPREIGRRLSALEQLKGKIPELDELPVHVQSEVNSRYRR